VSSYEGKFRAGKIDTSSLEKVSVILARNI
jgi:hypothetical protein